MENTTTTIRERAEKFCAGYRDFFTDSLSFELFVKGIEKEMALIQNDTREKILAALPEIGHPGQTIRIDEACEKIKNLNLNS